MRIALLQVSFSLVTPSLSHGFSLKSCERWDYWLWEWRLGWLSWTWDALGWSWYSLSCHSAVDSPQRYHAVAV